VAPIIGVLLKWSSRLVQCAVLFSVEIVFHFSGTSVGVLRLFDHFNLVAIQKIIVAAVKCVAVLILLILGRDDLTLFVTVYVIADIIGHIVLTVMSIYAICKNNAVSIKGIFKASTKEYNKQFWGFAFWSNLATSIDIPVKQLDVFIMSFINYDMVAVFKVYKQIGNILVELSVPISQSIMPQFSDLVARGKTKDCYLVMEKLHKTIIIVMIPCTIIITIISPKLLLVIFGPLYSKYFFILSIYLLIRSYALSYTAVHQLFTSMGLVREDFLITGLSNILYLAIAFALVEPCGITGVLIALTTQVLLSINLKKYKIKRLIDWQE